MKVLTVCQPYAHLLCLDEHDPDKKKVENRKWGTPHRGLILIHAGKSESFLNSYSPLPENMSFGAIIGAGVLEDCVHYVPGKQPPHRYGWLADHKHAEGPTCWIIPAVYAFKEPVFCSGAQGLWTLTGDAVQQVEAQLRKVGH